MENVAILARVPSALPRFLAQTPVALLRRFAEILRPDFAALSQKYSSITADRTARTARPLLRFHP